MGACSQTLYRSQLNLKRNGQMILYRLKIINFIIHKNDGMNDYVIEMTLLSKFDKNKLTTQADLL